MKILNTEQQAKPRTRRLRKKLRVGEFQELGFTISFRFDSLRHTLDQALVRIPAKLNSHSGQREHPDP